ncbi:MAG: hypothetical protein ACYDBA_13150 [Sulfuricaulis sp.]
MHKTINAGNRFVTKSGVFNTLLTPAKYRFAGASDYIIAAGGLTWAETESTLALESTCNGARQTRDVLAP